jgi:peptidoglycan/LPS O-acetylase OafA/YrhL
LPAQKDRPPSAANKTLNVIILILKWLYTKKPLGEHIEDHRLNNFGLIRLLAAFLVMETHSHLLSRQDGYYLHAYHISYLGLPSFFFLSGLLVTQSLYRSSSWKNFCWRRFLRVYPGAIAAILITALLIGPIVTTSSLGDYFSSPVLYQYLESCSLIHINFLLPGVFKDSVLKTASVNASLWTVSLEIKLYIALLIAWMLKWPGRRIGLLILIAILISASFLIKKDAFGHMALPYLTYGVQFLSGVLCYLYRDKILIRGYWLIILPLAFALSGWLHIYSLTAYLLIPALVLFTATYGLTWTKKITPKADLSYGIYLYAFPVQQLVANYLHPASPLILFLTTALATLIPATLSWYVVEKRALRLKRRIP